MGKLSRAMDRLDESAFTEDAAIARHAHEPTIVNLPRQNSQTATHQITSSVAPSDPEAMEKWNERLTSATSKFSAIAENIRKLRTMILHNESGEQIRSVLVTSGSPQEGKSFICANLGVSIAKSIERHAMMLDCDLRRPSLHTLFGLDPDRGLVDYLLNRQAIPDLILRTGLSKLSLIPAGDPPDNPSELLTAKKMAAMVEEMTSRYNDRLLILDSPPFSSASETMVLSQHVDKVVLVLRWGVASEKEVRKIADQIGSDKLLGVVFNAVETNILDRKIRGLSYQDYYYSNNYY